LLNQKTTAILSLSTAMEQNQTMLATQPSAIASHPPIQIADEAQLLQLWLHGKSPATQTAYRRDLQQFYNCIEHKPLLSVMLGDLQQFAQWLACRGYAIATQQRRLNAVKSLISFACDVGYLSVNWGRLIKPPKAKNTLAERILSEEQVLKIIALAPNLRNQTLLRLLYSTGARVSELAALRWRDVSPAAAGRGQVTLFGKGARTRVILFSAATWEQLQTLRGSASHDAPIFQNQRGGALCLSQIQRIVKQAGVRVGQGGVSPHWLRHAHASHALERGAPIQLVQTTLGVIGKT
jgi:integrase/recombinase XerD